jgi:HK97 gp10 family phage protein
MRSHKRYQAFLDSMARRRAIDIHNVRGVAAGDIGIGPQEITSQTSAAGPRSWRKPHLTQRTGFSGHPNTLIPVFRSGRYTVTGDFRRLGPLAGAIGQNRGRAGRKAKRPEFVDAQKAEGYRAAQLTSAGRYEVRQALKRTSRSALFQGRVGGRLRGELRIRGPERHAGSWWMYVESPTPYAPYQEFGTAHNRAHPFLRPALYESRNVLRFEVRKAVDPRVNTLPAEG